MCRSVTFAIWRGAVEALRGSGAPELQIVRDIAVAWGLVRGPAHLLIEEPAHLLQPIPTPEREAIVTAAVERLVASLWNPTTVGFLHL